MKVKKCSRCGRELPTTEFNWANRATGKLQSTCRSCCSRYNKARYASDRERFKADVRRYKSENPEKVLETRLKTNAKCPTKLNAQKCVEAALKCGAIVRPDVCWGSAREVAETSLTDWPLKPCECCRTCRKRTECPDCCG